MRSRTFGRTGWQASEVGYGMWGMGDHFRPTGAHEVTTLAGHVVPGLVDAHCHIGLDAHGALRRHDAYRWGPPIYENRGPAHIQEIVWRIVPEENTRLAAVLTGQSQATQYVPYSGMAQIRANRNLRIVDNPAAFWTYFIGFKVDKVGVDDAVVRRAMVMAVDQEAISRDINFGETEPAYSLSLIHI